LEAASVEILYEGKEGTRHWHFVSLSFSMSGPKEIGHWTDNRPFVTTLSFGKTYNSASFDPIDILCLIKMPSTLSY
jgi:hypothetical protein